MGREPQVRRARGLYMIRTQPKTDPKTPIEKLIKYRFDHKLTYVEFSKKLNVSDALLKGIIYGVNRMQPRFAIKLAKAIGCDERVFLIWALEQFGAWNKNWEIIDKRKDQKNEIHPITKQVECPE